MFIIKSILILLWMLVIPWLIGMITVREFTGGRMVRYFFGLMMMFSVALILSLFWTWGKGTLNSLTIVFVLISIILAAAGTVHAKTVKKSKGMNHIISYQKSEKSGLSIYLTVAMILIVVQMILAAYYAHFDADDSFYIGTATTAIQTNTVFRYNAYTGFPLNSLPARYVLSPFPIFLAIMSKISLGMHPAIISHVFFTFLFIGMGYGVYGLYAKRWFPQNRDLQGIFLILCSAAVAFACYARHMVGAVMLIRIWQGKAFFAAVMIPLLVYICLELFVSTQTDSVLEEQGIKTEKSRLLLLTVYLFLAGLGSCLLSSMAIALSLIIIMGFAVLALIIKKSLRLFLTGCICCIPEILFGLCYMVMR